MNSGHCGRSEEPGLRVSDSGGVTEFYFAAVAVVSSRPCNSLPGLKRTALPGGMLTSSPVRGLRPMPVLRGLTLKTPNLRNSILWPRPMAFFNDSKMVSTACSAFVRLMLVFATTAFTISSLITLASGATWPDARGCGAGCQEVPRNLHFNFLGTGKTPDREAVNVCQARQVDTPHGIGAWDDRAFHGSPDARRGHQLWGFLLWLRHSRRR